MSSILIKNADYLVTMDKKRRVLRNASLFIEGPKIKEVLSKRKKADKVIDASGMIVLPGFINTHHHMFQTLFRSSPKLYYENIETWINNLCNLARNLDKDGVYYAALASMAELLLSGCTSTVDFFYLFPQNKNFLFEQTIKASKEIGVRFFPCRGCMSLSQKDGALFPDDMVEDREKILVETQNAIEKYHDNAAYSMLNLGVAPCSPFTVDKKTFKKLVKLARKHKVLIHTHLAETEWEIDYCLKNFGVSPLDYIESLGCIGKDVVLVHCIYLNRREIKKISKTNTGVSHCPISNAHGERVASITEMLEEKVNISIGVDGSAVNDSSNMLEEMRWAKIVQGIRENHNYLKPYQVLEMATLGGARVLGRSDLGSIEPEKAADITMFKTSDKIDHAGAVVDPVWALISCQAIGAEVVIVNGRVIIKDGRFEDFDLNKVIKKTNFFAKKIVQQD